MMESITISEKTEIPTLAEIIIAECTDVDCRIAIASV